ncbi:MAG: LysR family transcriptional regulator [Rubrivivax sp.]
MTAAAHRLADLSLDDFALFVRVAELRNLSAVARERDVPPSQISRALARLEARCGVRLVHRSTHGLSLTEEGDAVLLHAGRLLEEAGVLEGALDERRGEPSGLVRVATSAVFAVFLLPTLGPLMDRHPRLRVELSADDRLVDLARDGIDVAIRSGAVGSEGLVARPLAQQTRSLYAAPAYLRAQGAPEEIADLTHHRLIANTANPALNRWRLQCGADVVEWRVDGTLRTDNTAVVLGMALEGLGIARLNDHVAAPHVASGRLVRVLPQCAMREVLPIAAVMLPARQRLPKVRACVDHFVAVFSAGRGPGAPDLGLPPASPP